MSEGPLTIAWSPQKFVRHGGGSGINGHTQAHPAVLSVLGRYDSWPAAFAEIVDLGLSDADIWSGGWLAEWPNIAARRELKAILAAFRRRGGLGGLTEAGETTFGRDSSTLAGTEAPGDLPGGLTWPDIQKMYGELAGAEVGRRSRRRHPDQPSRPETAKMLGVSTSTLKRACVKAGKGSRWPPADILTM